MNMIKTTKTLLCISSLGAMSAFAEPVQSVLFQGDYGGNRNSAIGTTNAGSNGYHYFSETDINGDSTADAKRTVPLMFPYVPVVETFDDGTNSGPKYTDFGIDESLFGVNSYFYIGSSIVNYSSAPGEFVPYGLYRYNGGADSFQLTSGNETPTDDMGLIFAPVIIKRNFLNGSKDIADLKLANEADAFTTTVQFRGVSNDTADPAGVRLARFLIRAGDTWYVSETTSVPDGEAPEKVVEQTMAINPAAEYWYEYDAIEMGFMHDAMLDGSPVRGDSLSDITATGVLIQNSRFDGLLENHAVWLSVFEFSMMLDPDPTPVVETGGWVDTGSWMGWLYEYPSSPWYYSHSLGNFVYLPNGIPAAEAMGDWAYVPAP